MAAKTSAPTAEAIDDFISKHEDWLERELPECGYGVSMPTGSDGYRLALRPRRITAKVAVKIEEFRQLAKAENIELDVRAL